MDNSTVKENITKIRQAAGMSQSDMADRLGLSRTAYRNLEKGETRLISINVERIAEILDTTTEELVLGYKPDGRESSGRLKDICAEFDSEKASMRKEYEKEISRLKEQIASLHEHIELLKDACKTKDEIIALLKKRLDEDGRNE